MFETKKLAGIVDTATHQELCNLITSLDFPWYYLEDTTFERSDKKSRSTPAFAHLLLHNQHRSEYLDKFTPVYQGIIDQLDIDVKKVFRMRLGFLMNTRYITPHEPYSFNEPHQDAEFPHVTACYHFWHSDGRTHIFNETEKSDKYTIHEAFEGDVNSAVVFDGLRYHASCCPKIHTKRAVLTVNFTI